MVLFAPTVVITREHEPAATAPVQVSPLPLTVTTTLPVGVPAPGETALTVAV